MKKAQNNYNVLIQLKSQNDAEKIVGIFRSAGLAVRAHRITSEQDLKEQLKDGGWDLLVADNHHPEVALAFSLEKIRAAKADLPVILVTDDLTAETMDRAFKLGIQDVINSSSPGHFSHAAKREMDNARIRNSSHKLEKEYNELRERAEQLLSESDEAIAYVSDGILMRTNEIFAQTFGYNLKDLDCASMIDLVSEADHARFKNFFRLFSKGEQAQKELVFQALKSDGEAFEAHMTLSASSIDGEPCTQVNISTKTSGGDGSGSGSGIIDTATGLHNRYFLAEQVAVAAAQIASGSKVSLLVYQLDDYEKLLEDVHLSGIDALIKDLVTQLESKLAAEKIFARLNDNSIAVILQQAPDASLAKAKDSLAAIESHICELGGRTIQYTCTCAVLNPNIKSATEMLDNAIDAIGSIRADDGKNHAQIYTPAAKQVAKSAATDLANIEEAIEAGSFRLLYQPMMSLQGDEVENYEATLWMADGNTLVYPDALIKSAKNSKLDRWIILESTKALSLHRASGHNTRLVINLTANALNDAGLTPWLGVAIKAANLSNDLLVFQFNEEDIRNNLKAAIKTITTLRDAKFRVSLSCFGKEPDPFKLLKHIKLDLVKIDARFTNAISSGDTKDLKKLIDEAKENSIKTILPEVDNASALATLWQLGTHYIQGGYLQEPRPEMKYVFTEIA